MAITLTEEQVRGIVRVQRVLLGSLDHPTADEWMADCVDAIGELLDADAVTMAVPSSDGVAVCWNDPSLDSATRSYLDHYSEHDTSLTEGRLELADPTVYHVRDILSRREIERDLVFAEWRAPNRLFDPLGICMDVGEALPALVHAYRDRDDGSYRLLDAKPIARLLAPTFKAGVRTRLRLRALRDDLAGIVDTVRDGVLLFDASARVLYCNRAAKELLEEDGLESPLLTHATRLVGEALNDSRVASGAQDRLGRIRLEVALLGPSYGESVAAVVSVTDERDRLPPVREVRRSHDLTPRQAEVALLMARRLSHKEIAKRLGIRPNTARRHGQDVLRRLGIHDRRDVRAVLIGTAE